MPVFLVIVIGANAARCGADQLRAGEATFHQWLDSATRVSESTVQCDQGRTFWMTHNGSANSRVDAGVFTTMAAKSVSIRLFKMARALHVGAPVPFSLDQLGGVDIGQFAFTVFMPAHVPDADTSFDSAQLTVQIHKFGVGLAHLGAWSFHSNVRASLMNSYWPLSMAVTSRSTVSCFNTSIMRRCARAFAS